MLRISCCCLCRCLILFVCFLFTWLRTNTQLFSGEEHSSIPAILRGFHGTVTHPLFFLRHRMQIPICFWNMFVLKTSLKYSGKTRFFPHYTGAHMGLSGPSQIPVLNLVFPFNSHSGPFWPVMNLVLGGSSHGS